MDDNKNDGLKVQNISFSSIDLYFVILLGTTHEVSLIDDEKSFASGLLGVYGRLVHTSEDVICVIHPYWQGIQMRWRLDDILDVRLIRTVGKDNPAGVFHIALRR